MRRSNGVATAMLILAGIPAMAPAAQARQVTRVPCSTAALVSAVAAANAAGTGTLELASSCNYALTAPSGIGRGPDGLLITGNIAIIGGNSTHIMRSPSAPLFRLIEVASGAVLNLRNVFVSGGHANGTVPANDTGGGILNSRGTLELVRTTVSGNIADSGAGVSNDSGRAIVENTLVTGNSTSPSGGGGGGFYNDGSLTIEVSELRGNHANTNGGGVYNGQGGRIETFRVTFDRNTAGSDGGALYEAGDGRAVLERTLVEDNTAASGGGIFNAGVWSRVSMLDSLIHTNTPNNCAPGGSISGCVG
jgi:predicted outer membrane repeat protein